MDKKCILHRKGIRTICMGIIGVSSDVNIAIGTNGKDIPLLAFDYEGQYTSMEFERLGSEMAEEKIISNQIVTEYLKNYYISVTIIASVIVLCYNAFTDALL